MKLATLSLALAALVCLAAVIGAGALGVEHAFATTTHQTAPKTLQIVMRDPGCHWFRLGHKFTTKAVVTGRVRLVNYDEAALRVMSHHGMRRIPMGKSLVVSHGSYMITMVGQASDDNHLRLTVR